METVILFFELIGTISFSLSGSLSAISKKLDIFGVLFCGIVTALGGGVFRDIMLGILPPAMFTDYIYAVFASVASIITFIIVKWLKSRELNYAKVLKFFNYLLDAAGLAVFTVVGINIAISRGFADNPFFAVFLGMTTGCGGGIIRDILIREIPVVFTKRIYAVASVVGGIIYCIILHFDICSDTLAMLLSMITIFTIRLLAVIFRWNLPKAS